MRYSRGTAEIVKMLDAKVDPQVIKTYIRSSQIACNPNSSEIIALKAHGVPDDILVAMMQHDAELRTQGIPNTQPSAPQVAAAPYATAPAYGYDYPATPYVDYGAYGYPYPYPYYDYWWYGNSWPFFSPFFVSFDVFGHRHFRGDFHHFHDGHSQFRGRDGFVRSGQPWASAGRFGGRSFAVQSGSAFQPRVAGFSGGFSGRSSAFAARSGGFNGRSSGSFAVHSGGFHSGGSFGGHSGSHR